MGRALVLSGLVTLVVAVPAVPGTVELAAGKTRASDASCSVSTTLPEPPADRPTYVLRIRVAKGLKKASGTESVSFRPAVSTDRLVFRLWPNSPFYTKHGASLTVGAVTVGGSPLVTSRPNPTTLVVNRSLAAGEQLTLSMPWKLRLPTGDGFQLRGGRTARLVSFFPILAWDDTRWATDPPLRHGNSFWPTSPTADFDVHVVVPRGLRVLATGSEVGAGHWRAQAVRDFGLAVGSFTVARSTIDLPRPVRVRVALERGSIYSIDVYLSQTVEALRSYSQTYAPYPWPTYTLAVMRDFPVFAGFAYPTITFLGEGSSGLIPHETAHQWFYSLVGNDQARDPWLSEGLATWAQTGPEHSLPTLLATTIPPDVLNRIGEPMSYWDPLDFEKLRLGVYVQTVQALASLGDPAAVDCALRQFVVQSAYRTTVPHDLLDALQPSFPDAEAKLTARGAHF